MMEPPSETTDLPDQKNNEPNCLIPTPTDVNLLENALVGYPDPEFVSCLCQNLRHGARIGFQGQRALYFSKNLRTALADPNVVCSIWQQRFPLAVWPDHLIHPRFPIFKFHQFP